MRTRLVLAAGAVALALSSSAARAQVPGVGISIAPYAGYMIFGDFLKGPVGSSLSSASGPVLGAQLGLRLAPGISLVGNVARASSDLEVGIPILGGVSVGESTAWMFDGGLQVGVPLPAGALSPFLQVGAGAIRHEVAVGPVDTKSTSFAGNIGLGADVAIAPNFALRLMAKDYVTKFDLEEATTLDLEGELTHNFALTAGVRIGF